MLHHNHYFDTDIDPYIIPGDPTSGVLPKISTEDPGIKGEGDHRVQAYCFRMCLSNHPDNRVPFSKTSTIMILFNMNCWPEYLILGGANVHQHYVLVMYQIGRRIPTITWSV